MPRPAFNLLTYLLLILLLIGSRADREAKAFGGDEHRFATPTMFYGFENLPSQLPIAHGGRLGDDRKRVKTLEKAIGKLNSLPHGSVGER